MSWTTPWTTSVPTILVVCAVLAWWFTEPKTVHLNLIVTIGCVLFFWAVAPEFAQQSPALLFELCKNIATSLHLDMLVLYHTNMLVVGTAITWLVHRAWQTLRKPVPELINVLGVDVPDKPDVSLAGIRSDAATLTWTRPRPNRPVGKFRIQVNGVYVGESAPQDTAITVTGLKPDHYYNVRVIAVGHNNFQAESRPCRFRTFAKDGRPELGNGRLPSNFVPEEQSSQNGVDAQDDDGMPQSPAAGVETASIADTSLVPAPPLSSAGVARRNTLTRKHSPSTTSMDQSVKDALRKVPEESLQKLGERFENIRKDMEEIQAQITKDEKEHKELMDELADEKKLKRRILKEKDDTTEKLKREMGSTDRAMRSAQQKKTQLEKRMKDKQSERNKLHNEMAKWEKDMMQMLKRRTGFEKDKTTIQEECDERLKELRVDIEALQVSLAHEEAELKEKGRELKEAEDQRKTLPGGEESEERREKDRQIRKDWEFKYQELRRNLFYANKRARQQEEYENVLRSQLATAQQSGLGFPYSQANSSGVDFDLGTQSQLKRRSRNSISMSNVVIPSPVSSFAMLDRSYASPSSFAVSRAPTLPPGFPGPFLDFGAFTEPLDEDGIRALAASAPLSPTATALLPAGIFDTADDYEPPSPASRPTRHNTFASTMNPDNDPQSPVSSGRSLSISSPRSSTQHLPFSQYTGENSERLSLRGDLGSTSPNGSSVQASNRFHMWPFQRVKPSDDEPPALGSLKPTQSRSLPRQSDDSDNFPNRRRISLSSGWSMFNRNSAGPDMVETSLPGSRGLAPRRGFGLWGHASSGSGVFSERDPSSPKPVSIASSDNLPRPSTDSSPSMWARVPPNARTLFSPEAGDPWSRTMSRRPSNESPPVMKTNLADADDEILEESDIRHAVSVGVIGSRPPAKTLAARLNPAAPSFMGMHMNKFFSKDKESNSGKEKEKTRAKAKDKAVSKERNPQESLTSASEATDTPSMDESPSDSRKSRDAFSVDTPSVSESRESLSLDRSFSNTPSEPTVGLGLKEPESGFKKLLRKGSSSKFSLSSIRGKKGPSSVANSDKNQSLDRTSFDIDEHGEDSGSNAGGPTFGRNYDSVNSSPSLGPTSSGRPNNNKVGWAGRFSMKKKSGKERESVEVDCEDLVPATPSATGEDSKA
ncbi:hypothetical protein BJ170DRAFT_596186 [Xylariales sp. AK1849]|nr:hypothetical protein BJ170DRAFT_596186 [Xylariales sp. AK1849]